MEAELHKLSQENTPFQMFDSPTIAQLLPHFNGEYLVIPLPA
jgi:hypothetical protein